MGQFLKKHYLILILVILNLAFAAVFGGDFGDSYDEQARYQAALQGIEDFSSLEARSNIGDKGPIYFVTAKLGGDLVRLLQPGLSDIQAWHQVHFLFFLFAVVGLYSIGLKFLSPLTSFSAAALFNTQPLLFGHAFINPKDIPFLSLFLLTIAIGIRIPDSFPDSAQGSPDHFELPVFTKTFRKEWRGLRPGSRLIALLALLPLAGVPILILLKTRIQELILKTINSLDENWLAAVLDRAAQLIFQGDLQDGLTLANVRTAYPFLEFVVLLIGGLIFLGVSSVLFTSSVKYLVGLTTWGKFKSALASSLRNPWIYLGGVVLGYSISNRSLGLAAGIYVLYYLWAKQRSRFLAGGLLYGSLTAAALYLSWPSLWANPILGLLKSILAVSNFSWGGKTLFWGTALSPDQLPLSYFPTLLALQLTIPAIILIFAGLVIYLTKRKEYQLDPALFAVIFIWFALPFASTVFLKPSIYDNFRHFLFITPPLFLLGGLGLRWLFSKLSQPLVRGVLIGAVLLPGIIGIVQLHPYQYIYYNELIGGVKGAFRQFETDYWYTAYVECIEYLDEEAPPSSTILVYGPAQIAEAYAREDLKILPFKSADQASQFKEADYFILTTRGNKDLELAANWQEIYAVTRDGVPLAVVRKAPH